MPHSFVSLRCSLSRQMRGSVINHMNGRSGKIGGSRGRKTMMSWMEAPDDVYFVANDATRSVLDLGLI